jgi:hypothetical protein
VVGTTQHEGAVELIPVVTLMGIAINYFVLFMDFPAARSGGSTEKSGESGLGDCPFRHFNSGIL